MSTQEQPTPAVGQRWRYKKTGVFDYVVSAITEGASRPVRFACGSSWTMAMEDMEFLGWAPGYGPQPPAGVSSAGTASACACSEGGPCGVPRRFGDVRGTYAEQDMVTAEKHLVIGLDFQRGQFAVFVDTAFADRNNLASLLFFFGRIGNHDSAGRLFFRLQRLNQHAVSQRLNF